MEKRHKMADRETLERTKQEMEAWMRMAQDRPAHVPVYYLSPAAATHYQQVCDALDWMDKHDPATCAHTNALPGDHFCSNCGARLQTEP